MLKLVVVGDSIAKGYGSTDYKVNSFGAILGQKLPAEVSNLGVVGLDSEGLLEKLNTEKFEEAIEDADVVCVSIGSNDLLKPFISIFADTLGVEGEEKELFGLIQKQLSSTAKKNPLKAADLLATTMKKMTDNKSLNKACKEFPDNFNEIISKIKQINSDTLIYADNIYNPYYSVAYEYEGISVFNVSKLCEPYIQNMNKAFKKSDDYTVVDMYSVFRQPGFTNVNPGTIENMGEINLDPHPNDAGYAMMADYIYTFMDSIVPYVSDAVFEEGEHLGTIKLTFSENVRLVGEKQLYILSENKKDKFVFEIPENTWIEKNESGKIEYEIELDKFVADNKNDSKEIIPGEEYTLIADDGSIKDKGNNFIQDAKILTFELPKAEVEVVPKNVNSVTGKNYDTKLFIIPIAFIIIIALAIIIKKIVSGKS